jgi:uncharacterized membrane protein
MRTDKKSIGITLLVVGFIFLCMGSYYAFYYGVMMSFPIYCLLLIVGIIFLIFSIEVYLKKQKNKISSLSLIISFINLGYLVVWFLSIMNEWPKDIKIMFSDNWLTPIFLAIFSIVAGMIALKKAEKINKSSLAGILLSIFCIILVFINIMNYNSTIIPIE